MIYIVRDTGYEHTEDYLMEGPEVQDWEVYCKSLMPEALEAAKVRYGDLPIGEDDLIWGLVQVLYKRGYVPYNITTASFWTDHGLRVIDNHNEANKEYNKELEMECSEVYGETVVNRMIEYNEAIRVFHPQKIEKAVG